MGGEAVERVTAHYEAVQVFLLDVPRLRNSRTLHGVASVSYALYFGTCCWPLLEVGFATTFTLTQFRALNTNPTLISSQNLACK